MDLTSPITTATVAPFAGAGAAVSGPPDYAARAARFDALANAASDTSGALDQRLAAYSDLQAMSAGGQLIGFEADRRQRLDQITYDSDIGQRAQQLSRGYVQAVNAAGQAGGASAALRAATAQLDGLSTPDQAILFAATLNAADRTGAKPYADLAAWRENTDAQTRVVDYMQASGVVGGNGRLDYRAAAAKAVSDPKFAQALRLSQARDNTSADWTASVQRLFGAARTADRLDLSPQAKAALDTVPPRALQPSPNAYTPGSVISRTA